MRSRGVTSLGGLRAVIGHGEANRAAARSFRVISGLRTSAATTTPTRSEAGKEMTSHVVLMKPRPDLSPADRLALVEAFEQAIREVPTVRGVRIGLRTRHGAGYEQFAPDSADYLIAIDFDDLAGLQAYLRHPAHETLGTRFNQSISSALVYDFEVGGVETLTTLK